MLENTHYFATFEKKIHTSSPFSPNFIKNLDLIFLSVSMTPLRLLAWCAVWIAGVARAGASSLVARVGELEAMNEVLMATNHELMDVIIPGLRNELKALREYVGAVDRGSFEHPVPLTQGADDRQDVFGSVGSRSFAQPVPSTQGADAGQGSYDAISQRKLSGGNSGSNTARILYDGSSMLISTHLNVSGNLYATTVSEASPSAPPSALFTSNSASTVSYSQGDVIACEAAVYDTYSGYNTANYKYTVPVSGIYHVYGKIFSDETPSGNTNGRVAIVVNNQEVVISGAFMTQTDVQLTYPLNKDDVVHLQASLHGVTNAAMWWGNTYWGLHMLSRADSIPTSVWW